jgi:hypothetical protein
LDLVAAFEAVPATVWGFMIGSIFTVIGVALTNASNTKRLRLQHEHERLLDARARDLTMRREVYLDAFEAIATGMTMVGNFGELDMPYQDLMRSFTSKSGAIGKVTMVGSERTVQAVTSFEHALTQAFVRLSVQRSAIDQHQQRLRGLTTRIERSEAEQERLTDLLEGGGDASSRRGLDYERQRAETLRADQSAVESVMIPALMQLIQASMEEVGTLSLLLAPVIREVRSELGLSFDEAFFVELIQGSHAQRMDHVQAIIEAVEGTSADAARQGQTPAASPRGATHT